MKLSRAVPKLFLGFFIWTALFFGTSFGIEQMSGSFKFSAVQNQLAQSIASTKISPAISTAPLRVIPAAQAQASVDHGAPVRLIIPAIKMDSAIVEVGLNSKGEMDVPNGKTNNVGWYKYGTPPGQIGSAVLDAHVFAAFSKLKYLKPGDIVYVITQSGSKLHFVVDAPRKYPLAGVPLDMLFNRNDGLARLNLITCAGKLTPDHSTYDHRLVIYSELVK